jgi:hypothetical protein
VAKSGDILFFGGNSPGGDNVPVSDICYTLIFQTGVWTNQPLPAPMTSSPSLPFIRFLHAGTTIYQVTSHKII